MVAAVQAPADAKECGNWLFGTLKGAVRNKDAIVSRSALTLDADHAAAHLPDAVEVLGCRALVHST